MAFANRSPIVMQARVFIQERIFNGPAISGLDWVGNCDNAALSIKQKTEDIKESYTGLGMTIANPVVETDADLTINAIDLRMENWALATFGEWGGTEASGSVSGESVVLYNGRYVQLAKPGVSNVSVSGAVLTTDYVVDNAAGGILRVLATSTTIPEGTPLTTTVSYDYAANNGKVQALTKGQKFYTIVLNGINVAQGNQPTIVTINQVQLEAAKKMDFIDRKKMMLELSGKLMQDSLLPLPSLPGDLSQFFSVQRA